MNKNTNEFFYEPVRHTDIYECSDFDLAVTLVAKNHELLSLERITDNKATFIFKRSKELQEAIDGYWSNSITVKPFDFASIRKKLKSRLFGMKTIRY